MKQALDALNESGLRWPNIVEAIKALEDALKQEQGELLANDPLPRACNLAGVDYQTFLKIKAYMPLYTTPQTKEWVWLTDEEIDECDWGQSERDHARAIEAKLKTKNGY